MKIEFNGHSYNVENKIIKLYVCAGCVNECETSQCPTDSEGQCILPLDKIYTNCYFDQVFKL